MILPTCCRFPCRHAYIPVYQPGVKPGPPYQKNHRGEIDCDRRVDPRQKRPKTSLPTPQGRENEKGPQQYRKGDRQSLLPTLVWTRGSCGASEEGGPGRERYVLLVRLRRKADQVPSPTIKHFEWFESNGKIWFKTHQSNQTICMV